MTGSEMKIIFIQSSDFFEFSFSYHIKREDYAKGHFNDWYFNIVSALRDENLHSRTVFRSLRTAGREEYSIKGLNAEAVFLPVPAPVRLLTDMYYMKKTGGVQNLYKYGYSFYSRVVLSYLINFMPGIIKEIRSYEPDLVIIQDYESKVYDGTAALMRLSGINIPIITIGTGDYSKQNFIEKAVKKLTLKRAKMHYCPNTVEYNKLKAKYGVTNSEFIVTQTVDDRIYRTGKKEARQAAGLDENKKYILFVGQISSPAKGFPYLHRAFLELKDLWDDAVLLVIGGGYKYPEQKFMKRVEYVKDKDELRNYYNACEFVVVPSEREGFPKVVIEAMACGKAVLGTAAGGIPDQIIDNVTGYVVPLRNKEALAAKIRYLLANPGECDRLGEAGLIRARDNYTRKIFTDNLLGIFNKAVKQS